MDKLPIMTLGTHIQNLLAGSFLLLFSLAATAQPRLIFDHLGPEDDLPEVWIGAIYQDSLGYMWFGTWNGVKRYDGREMTTYSYDPTYPSKNYPNFVWDILEDHQGNMWVRDGYAIFLYHPEEDEFELFTIAKDSIYNTNRSNGIGYLYPDKQGRLWVGTLHHGLMELNRETGQFVPFAELFEMDLKPEYVTSILQDSFGNLWFSYPNGLYQFVLADSSLIYHPFREDYERTVDDRMINVIFEDSRQNLWVGTRSGLFRFDRKEKVFSPYLLDPQSLDQNYPVRAICEADDETLWVGVFNRGLYILDIHTDEIFHYPSNPEKPGALGSNNFWTLYRDRFGDMWIGTGDAGVFYWSRNRKAFAALQKDPDDPGSIIQSPGRSFFERENGQIWVTTPDELQLFDPDREAVVKVISYKDGLGIVENKDGQIWVGSWSNGLTRFPFHNRPAITYRADPSHPDSLPATAATEVYADRQGTIWVGVWQKSLYRYDPQNDAFVPHPLIHPQNGDTVGISIRSFHEDQMGNLWIGSKNGLSKLRKDGTIDAFYDIPRCQTIHEDHKNQLWLGTEVGLYCLDINTGDYKLWRKKDGLPFNIVNGILEDNRGNIWLGTARGLSRFDPNVEKFRNYNTSDGLPSDIFIEGACLKTQSGEFYFGLNNGILRFHPDSIRDNPNKPPIVITDFQIRNRSMPISGSPGDTLGYPSPLLQNISYAKEIRLTWRQNHITFEFAALNYFHPEKNRYRYHLENYDDDTIATDAQRPYAHYTLDPGRYTFWVTGSNNDGEWNLEGTSIRLIITPPWWWNTWSKAFYVILFLFGLWAIRRYEMKRQQLHYELEMEHLKSEKLVEVDELKTRLYTNITHEFRTPLTVIQGLVSAERTPSAFSTDFEAIHRNAQHLLDLINRMLDLSKLDAGQLDLHPVQGDILPFLRYVTESFHSFALNQKINLNFYSDAEEIVMDYDPEKVLQVLSNLLSNALKFTPEYGKVQVVARKQRLENRPILELTVRDTGIGITPEKLPHIFDRFYQAKSGSTRRAEGTGIGLALTKELVDLMRGTIEVESEVGEGTRFTIRLPITNNGAPPEGGEGRADSRSARLPDFMSEQLPAWSPPPSGG